jgi:hypothetical protein
MMASISSDCPLPSMPAMPSTSPLCTANDTLSTIGRRSSSRTVRPVTSSATSSVTVDSVVSGDGSSEPTISSARSAAVTELESTVVTVLPRRITVIRSEISSTSCSLWSMKMIVAPPACSSRRLRKSSSTSCGTSTAVGSSRIRIRPRGTGP